MESTVQYNCIRMAQNTILSGEEYAITTCSLKASWDTVRETLACKHPLLADVRLLYIESRDLHSSLICTLALNLQRIYVHSHFGISVTHISGILDSKSQKTKKQIQRG